jgi:hypothetical protein
VTGVTFSTLEFVSRAQEEETRYKPNNFGSTILKSAKLSHLGIYFNTYSDDDQRMFTTLTDLNQINRGMRDLIANQQNLSVPLDYILLPDQFVANMFVHRKPQEDSFQLPLLDIEMVLDRFSITFTKTQYDSLLYLLENVNQFTVSVAYRKWRPTISLAGNSREWWKFAFTAILETDVRRRRRNWSWKHMKDHINNRKKYKMLYKKKLMSENLRNEELLVEMLDKLEEQLDMSSIVLARKQVRFEVADSLEKRRKEKQAKTENTGYLSGIKSWWSKKSNVTSEDKSNEPSSLDLVSEVRKELNNPEEKAKLYQAIGYDELHSLIDYPLGYIAQIFHFKINTFNVSVEDQQKNVRIAHFVMDEVKIKVNLLPTSNGIGLTSSIKSIRIFGLRSSELPMVEALSNNNKSKMLDISFEMNPLSTSTKYDFGVKVQSQGLRFVYDADTIKELTSIGQNYDVQNLQQIQSIAVFKIQELKKLSSESLVTAIRQHKKLKLELEIEPSFLLIPEKGNMNTCSNVLIVSIGPIQIVSNLIEQNQNEFKELLEKNPNDFLKNLRQSAYENYNLNIRHVQIALCERSAWEQDLQQMSAQTDSKELQKRYLLRPFTLRMVFSRSIILDDPDLAQYKVESMFSSIQLVSKSEQVIRLLKLMNSITEASPEEAKLPIESKPSNLSKLSTKDDFDIQNLGLTSDKSKNDINKLSNLTNFYGKFAIESILLEGRSDSDDVLFRIKMNDLNAKIVVQTQAKKIEVVVTTLQLIFCVDHFAKLMHLQEQLQTLMQSQSSKLNELDATEANNQVKTPQPQSQSPIDISSFAVKGQFYLCKAEFAMIGNLNNPLSPVVAFNVTLLASLEQLPNLLLFNADFQQTQMAITNVTKFDAETDNDMCILNPCDISLHFRQEGTSHNINVSFTDFVIYISPNLVQILLSLLNKLSLEPANTKRPEVTTLKKKRKSKLFTVRPLKTSTKYWFLNPIRSEMVAFDWLDQCETSSTCSSIAVSPMNESAASPLIENQIIVHLPTIQLVIESGGSDTKPMLKLQASLLVKLDNYTDLNSKLNLFVEYFNDKKLAWEPVIDKIDNEAWPFEVNLKLLEQRNSLVKRTEVSIESKNRLEMTLTDNCLFVLNDLGKWFSNAVTQPETLMRAHQQLVLSNHIGISLCFIIDTTKFKLKETDLHFQVKRNPLKTIILLENGNVCSLDVLTNVSAQSLSYYFAYNNLEIHRSVQLNWKDKKVYDLKAVTYPGGTWKYVVDMTKEDVRSKYISFKSVVELKNHLNLKLEVHYSSDNKMNHLSTIEPNESFFLPLELVYSENPYVYVKPTNYLFPLKALTWRSVHPMNKKVIRIDCDNNEEGEPPYFIRAVTSVQRLPAFEKTPTDDDQNFDQVFLFDLYPPFLLRNLLPYPISFKQFKPNLAEEVLPSGQTSEIKRFNEGESVLRLTLNNYQGTCWTAFVSNLRFNKEDTVQVCQLTGTCSGAEETLLLALNLVSSDENGHQVISVFAPFWMINQTVVI